MPLPSNIETVALSVLNQHGCELVDGTFRREQGGLVLRLLIERSGSDPDRGSGVDHRLCTTISRDLGAALDVEDIIEQHYTLEVSSPGIERPLVKASDFERFAGRQVSVKTLQPVEGCKHFKGILRGLDRDRASVDIGDGRVVVVPLDNVKKANLVFDPMRSNPKAGDR